MNPVEQITAFPVFGFLQRIFTPLDIDMSDFKHLTESHALSCRA
jgi:hypothetical protein